MFRARHRLLTSDEEQQLAHRIAAGDKAAVNELVRDNMALVYATATKRRRCGLDYGDIVQEGMMGLLHAASKYRPGTRARFATYAFPWIRNAITRFVDRNLRITCGGINERGADGKMRPSKRRDVLLRLDRPIGEDGRETIGDIFADTQAANEDRIIAGIDSKRIKDAVDSMMGRTGAVMRAHMRGAPIMEIVKRLDVARETATRDQARGYKRLRRKFADARQMEIVFS